MLKTFLYSALLAGTALTAQASNLPDYPFIHTSGTGAAYAVADTGTLDFEIAAFDADPAAASALVETRANEIRALAGDLAIAAADLEFRDVRKDIRKPEAGAAAGTIVYELRLGVHITVRDLGKWQALVAPLLTKPNLDGFMTEFDTSQREKIEMDLMNQALQDARRKAQLMAAGLGRQLGAANAVSNSDLKNLTRAMGLAPSDVRSRDARRAGLDRASVLTVGILKFAQTVDVIFRIK